MLDATEVARWNCGLCHLAALPQLGDAASQSTSMARERLAEIGAVPSIGTAEMRIYRTASKRAQGRWLTGAV